MNSFKILLTLLGFSLLSNQISAQLVNGCGFLQENRLEIGIANNGAYGTPEDAPVGFHPNNNPLFAMTYNPVTGSYIQHTNALGFVADYDSNGWAVGVPPYFGDYFLPGTPQEGWSVEVNGIRTDAFSSNYQTSGATGFVGGPLSGTNQWVTTAAGVTQSQWLGAIGALAIKQTTTVKTNKLYFTANVKFYNTGAATLNNVYYMRTLDPDNDVSFTNNFTTINDITYQLPNPGNKSLVGATSTTDTNAYLGLGTIDCRSKVFICDFGLFPPSNVTDTLGYLFSGTHPDLTYTGTMTSDVGIGIVYQLGNIAPGDSTELNFAYILNEASLDDALDEIKPQWLNNSALYQSNDTIFACPNTQVPVSIVHGDDFSWTWSSTAPMTNTTGISNTVTLGTTPVTVYAYGVGICLDTIQFVLAPGSSVTTTINAGICSGAAYVFNGVSYSTAGTYHDTVTTASGCDSIVTLVLTVGANTSHTINASVCQGTGYVFNGNTLNVAGTYYDTLTNSVGCDSLIILNLLVGTTTYGSFAAVICQGQSYFYNGQNLTAAGTYLDTIVNSNGCDSILTLNLTVKPVPVASFVVDKTQICSNDSIIASYTGPYNSGNSYAFNSGGGTLLSGTSTSSGPFHIQWSSGGVKTLTLTVTLNGCTSLPATQVVTVIDVPVVDITNDTSICLDATAQVIGNVTTPSATYSWNLGSANLVSGSTAGPGPLTLSYNTIGQKIILLQCDNSGCLSNVDTAKIEVHPMPTANIVTLDGINVYCETDEVHLSTDNVANSFYQWTPLTNFIHYDYNTATMIIYDTTLVTMLVTTSYGCTANDSIMLYTSPCDQFFIPNSFSPNGDNINDVFHVVGLHPNAKVDMMIYNRWGQRIFESDDANFGWNGYFKGIQADNGVYFYYIKITFPTGITKIVKGDLTLLR